MARSGPLTWRNVAAPRFNNTGLATAISALDSATADIKIRDDRFKAETALEDDRLTNIAIADALRTGQIPTDLSDRVDIDVLNTALEGKQTSDAEQAKSAALTAGYEYDNSVAPAEHAQRIITLKGQALAAKNSGRLTELQYNETLREIAREDKGYSDLDKIRKFEQKLKDDEYDRLYQEAGYGPDAFGGSGTEPTRDEANGLLAKAEAYAEGRSGHAQIGRYMNEIGIDDEYRKQTDYFARETLSDANDAALALEKRKFALTQRGREQQNAENMANGNNSLAIFKNGAIATGTKAEIEAEKIKSYADGIARLGSVGGVNTSQIDKDDKELLQRAMAQFPNISMFAGAASTYFAADGTFDRKNFAKALNSGGQDLILRQINLDRVARGLNPLTPDLGGGEGDGSLRTGSSNRDIRSDLAKGTASTAEVVGNKKGAEATEAIKQNAENFNETLKSVVPRIATLREDPIFASNPKLMAHLGAYEHILTTGTPLPARPGSSTFLGRDEGPLSFEQMQTHYEDFNDWVKTVRAYYRKHNDVQRDQATDALQQILANE